MATGGEKQPTFRTARAQRGHSARCAPLKCASRQYVLAVSTLHVLPRGGGVEKKFLETAYSFFCAANPRRVGGVRKFFPYTYDQKFYQTKPFQSKNSAR